MLTGRKNAGAFPDTAPHPILYIQHTALKPSFCAAAASWRGTARAIKDHGENGMAHASDAIALAKSASEADRRNIGRSAGTQAAAHVGVDVC
jgi:hypothetical protein